jgi:hypothetical protein
MQFSKQYYTFEEVCNICEIPVPKFITTNPNLTKFNGAEYDIVRGSKHDGTAIFTKELLFSTIQNVINGTSICIGRPTDNILGYEVGLISLATVYGTIDLPSGRHFGERQRARLPVRIIRDYYPK